MTSKSITECDLCNRQVVYDKSNREYRKGWREINDKHLCPKCLEEMHRINWSDCLANEQEPPTSLERDAQCWQYLNSIVIRNTATWDIIKQAEATIKQRIKENTGG